MQSPYDNGVCPTPSAAGNHQGTRGGVQMEGGQSETPGTGGIPNQPTLTTFDGIGPGADVGAGKDISEFQANRTFTK